MSMPSVPPVGCVIMASGQATRFGSNKLLAEFGGRPLIARALEVSRTPALACRVLVTRWPEVARLGREAGVETVLHSLPGRNDTVRLGLEALLARCPGLAGCIFLPGDQPLLRQPSLEAMVQAFAAPGRGQKETEQGIFRLGCRADTGPGPLLGSPVLFGSAYFSALLTLPQGKGGGAILQQHPQKVQPVLTPCPQELLDADTPQGLAELEKWL